MDKLTFSAQYVIFVEVSSKKGNVAPLFRGLLIARYMPAAALALVSLLGAAAQAQVKVVIYKTSTQIGGGAPYSNSAGTLHSPDIQFGTASHFNWHPFGLSAFGADATGTLDVAATGTYTFTLHTDDGSQLFIDNELAVDNGGPHYQTTVSSSIALTQGRHSFEVQYFENGYDDSGLDLNLPPGVSYAAAEGESKGFVLPHPARRPAPHGKPHPRH